MKKLLAIFVLAPLFCVAQEEEADEKKIRLGLAYSVDYTFRSLNNTSAKDVFDQIVESRESREKASINGSFGLQFAYRISKKFELEIGASYLVTGYETEPEGLVFGDVIDPRRGFSYTTANLPTSYHLKVTQKYSQVGFQLGYVALDKKIQVIPTLGFGTAFAIQEKATGIMEYADGSTDSYAEVSGGMTALNIAALSSIQINYKLKEKFIIQLRPNYRRSFTSVHDEIIKEYPYSFGLGIGFFIRL